MRFSKALLILTLAIVGTTLWSATSAETITAGGACHSITPSQASLMEWREEGIKNSSSTDYWVLCPIQRSAGSGEKKFSLRVFNESDADLSLQCYFREIFDNRRLQAKSVEADLSSSGSENLSWVMTPQEAKSAVNVACKLPNGLLIEAITSGTSGTSDNNGGTSDDVYACITAPTEFFSSSASVVVMKNGAELNNFDGRTWSSGDRHLMFQTVSGSWYTDQNDLRTYQIDVSREPETCFTPDLFEVINKVDGTVSPNYDLIEWNGGGSGEIKSSCAIDVGSILYLEDRVVPSALDVLTAEKCNLY